MFPLPSLGLTGGAGGSSTTGATQNTVPSTISFGGFNVGGSGSQVEGGTASTATGTIPAWVWPALLILAAAVAFAWILKQK